ncbi:MAG: cytochrome c [Pseudomonadota bacterium]
MRRARRPAGHLRRVAGLAAGAVFLLQAGPAHAFFHNQPDLERGRAIYTAKCASCHGANLQGQPDWQTPRADGTYPAPPHDETGHTWHHGDTMLRDYIRLGGQAVLDNMGVEFVSGMPGFGSALTEEDIEAVLAYIKSTWPDPVRAAQEDRTRAEAENP